MIAALPLLRSAAPWIAIAFLAVACWGLWQRADRIAAERDQAQADLDRAVQVNENNRRSHQFEIDQLTADLWAAAAACDRRVQIARQAAAAEHCIRTAPVTDDETDVSPVLRDALNGLR